MAALSVLRIHSERLWRLRFAAAVMAFKFSALKRTGTIRPFACPFGRFGLPTLLGFFIWRKAPKLLYDCCSHRFPCGSDWRNVQYRNVASGFLRVIRVMRPKPHNRIPMHASHALDCPDA